MATLARFRWLVAATVLGSLVGFLGSYLLSPQYSARAVIEELPPRPYDYWGPFDKSASQKLATYLLQTTFSLSQRRAGCANQRPSESVCSGAASDGCPDRARQLACTLAKDGHRLSIGAEFCLQ
jgi:hypothetical protein